MQTENEILANLLASQGRVEGKVDTLMETWKLAHADNEDWKASHEDRVSHLERKTNFATGIVAFLTFIVSPLIYIFHK